MDGDLRQWHRVVIDFQGPPMSESAVPNPFADYRLNVTFFGPRGQVYVVPGYFAADGNAAETSAKSGRIWRVCFTPDSEGGWDFRASFRAGKQIAASLDSSAGIGTIGGKVKRFPWPGWDGGLYGIEQSVRFQGKISDSGFGYYLGEKASAVSFTFEDLHR